MIKWKKPSGKTIETNEEKATIEAALGHGWKLVKPAKKPAVSKEMKALVKEAKALGIDIADGDDEETLKALIDAAKK